MAKNLTAFLAQNAKKIDNVTFIASDRFVDPDTGEAMPWEICCITAAENAGLRKACMRTVPVPGRKGQFTQDFDANAYLAKVAVRCTVFPNLNDAELQQSYGVMGAEQLITTMLTPAEFEDYSTTLAIVWKTGDTSPLAYLIPAIFAELATATGFYYSKAKAENRIKLRKKYGPDIYNDSKED